MLNKFKANHHSMKMTSKIKTYVPLPKCIADKKAVINMKNDNNQSFNYAVTRALNPVDVHPERITNVLREQSKQLDRSGIEFNVAIKDIAKFEKKNNLVINVCGVEGETCIIHPLKHTRLDGKVIDLLLHKGHYCLIKDFGRLINSQVSKNKGKRYHCKRCMNSFTTEFALQEHDYYCKHHEARRVIVDAEDVQFKNFNKSLQVPAVI
jgi:hypothetical protein